MFLAPPRIWIWLLSLQLAIGVLVTYLLTQPFRLGWAVMYAAANSLDAIVGATIAVDHGTLAVRTATVNGIRSEPNATIVEGKELAL